MTSARKAFFIMAGLVCFFAGTIGIFLPILPTVPLYLLAGICLASGSDRLSVWFESTSFYREHVAPIKAGDTLGKATFSYDNEVWFTADMTAASDVVQVDQVSSEAKDIVSLTDDVSGSDTPFNEEGSNLPLVFGINLVILALVVAAYFTMKMINKKQSIHHPEEEK